MFHSLDLSLSFIEHFSGLSFFFSLLLYVVHFRMKLVSYWGNNARFTNTTQRISIACKQISRRFHHRFGSPSLEGGWWLVCVCVCVTGRLTIFGYLWSKVGAATKHNACLFVMWVLCTSSSFPPPPDWAYLSVIRRTALHLINNICWWVRAWTRYSVIHSPRQC